MKRDNICSGIQFIKSYILNIFKAFCRIWVIRNNLTSKSWKILNYCLSNSSCSDNTYCHILHFTSTYRTKWIICCVWTHHYIQSLTDTHKHKHYCIIGNWIWRISAVCNADSKALCCLKVNTVISDCPETDVLYTLCCKLFKNRCWQVTHAIAHRHSLTAFDTFYIICCKSAPINL